MNTITPIIIPVSSEPERCPKCGKTEDRREVCGHCGYEYPESDGLKWWEVILLVLIFISVMVLLFSFAIWAMDYSNEQSFVEFLWDGIKSFFGLFGKIF